LKICGNKVPARAFILFAQKGIIMETEHVETVVDKGVAYVKDILGLLADGEVASVVRRPVPEHDLTSDDALRLDDPHTYTFNQIVERSRHSCEEHQETTMKTEHTEGVIEKALAFVKHTLGIPPVDQIPEVVAKPEYTDTAPVPTIEGAMRLDPHIRTLKIGTEINAERRDDESANSAANERVHAPEQLHRVEGSVQKALDDIQDISRGMSEKFVDENLPSYKELAEHGGKKMPSESAMQQADKCARDADRKEKNRQAEQQSAGW
jgi:hypothetical protein